MNVARMFYRRYSPPAPLWKTAAILTFSVFTVTMTTAASVLSRWLLFLQLPSKKNVTAQVAQAAKGAVNMTLRNSVIFIRVNMGIERSYKIVQNRGKRFNKIDSPSHLLCITCVSTAFGGVSKRFQWVLGSLFSSPYIWRGKQRTLKRG